MNKTLLKTDRKAGHFTDSHIQRNFRIVTVLMFIFLIFEKVFSGETAFVYKGHIEFYFSLGILDLVSIFVYSVTIILLRLKVKYNMLLVPDFLLLIIKIYCVTTGIINITYNIGYVEKLSNIEKIVEGVLFSAFLICLFYGKLFKNYNFKKICPYVCFVFLILCFITTITIEVYKLIISPVDSIHSFIYYFNFFKSIANELFLDMPYFMLTYMVFFIPEEKRGY